MGISAPGMASRRLIMAMAMAAAAVLAEEKMLYGEFGEMTPSQWEAKNTQLLKDQQKNSRSVMNKAGELETIWQYWDSDKRQTSTWSTTGKFLQNLAHESVEWWEGVELPAKSKIDRLVRMARDLQKLTGYNKVPPSPGGHRGMKMWSATQASTVQAVEKGVAEMRHYQKSMDVGAGEIVAGLEIVRDSSFAVAGSCAAVIAMPVAATAVSTVGVTGGSATVLAGGISGGVSAGGFAAVQNLAEQAGEASTKLKGQWGDNVVGNFKFDKFADACMEAGVKGFVTGAAGELLKVMSPGVAKYVVDALPEGTKVDIAKVEKILNSAAFAGVYGQVVDNIYSNICCGQVTSCCSDGKKRMTGKDWSTSIATGLIAGGLLDRLGLEGLADDAKFADTNVHVGTQVEQIVNGGKGFTDGTISALNNVLEQREEELKQQKKQIEKEQKRRQQLFASTKNARVAANVSGTKHSQLSEAKRVELAEAAFFSMHANNDDYKCTLRGGMCRHYKSCLGKGAKSKSVYSQPQGSLFNVKGLCSGDWTRKCCLPMEMELPGDEKCKAAGGFCAFDGPNKPANGRFKSGKCYGPAKRRCLVAN